MRIALVIPNFSAGGAERVASLLCNAWVDDGHTVTAITFEPQGTPSVYKIDPRISLEQLDTLNRGQTLISALLVNARRVSRLRATIKAFSPDVVVGFTTEANVVALQSANGFGVPVVVSERNQPDRPGLGWVRPLARRLAYPKAAAIVVQTEAIASWVRQRFQVPVHVIPNPIRLEAWQKPSPKRADQKLLVAAGRLVPQKGFDRLIASFARLASRHGGWKLVIYGEGRDRNLLEAEIRNLGLTERVLMPGVCTDMAQVYADASLFVLPSRYEGYPNVLIEALAAGCPVIATDCPGAVREILADGLYGFLVANGDDDGLTWGLEHMMSNEKARDDFAARARRGVEHLECRGISRRWLRVILDDQSRYEPRGEGGNLQHADS